MQSDGFWLIDFSKHSDQLGLEHIDHNQDQHGPFRGGNEWLLTCRPNQSTLVVLRTVGARDLLEQKEVQLRTSDSWRSLIVKHHIYLLVK